MQQVSMFAIADFLLSGSDETERSRRNRLVWCEGFCVPYLPLHQHLEKYQSNVFRQAENDRQRQQEKEIKQQKKRTNGGFEERTKNHY